MAGPAKVFEGRVALVTGGTTGIGRAAAIAFARRGAKVVVTGRREKEGGETVAAVKDVGGQGLFIKGDVTREGDVRAWVDGTMSAFGRLDFAFNNAGIESVGPISDVSEAEYRKVFDINVLGVIFSMKHEIPAMIKSGVSPSRQASIVNTSSIAGRIGMAGVGVYVGSKHAVNGITKCVALEVAKQGIRVNVVSPAAIDTQMFDRFASNDDARNYMASLHPIGRIGAVDEVAGPVMFLCSDEASFVTGADVVIDGGFTVP